MRGKTNNPFGRPKGVPNKVNSELRQRVSDLINDNWENIQSDIDALEPKERLSFLEKLMGYSLPKLQSVQLDGDSPPDNTVTVFQIPDNGRDLDYKSMTDEQLREIVARGSKQLPGKGEGKS